MHELGLEVHGVEKLLLPLPLDVEPLDLVLQVLDRGPGTEDLAESRRLNPGTNLRLEKPHFLQKPEVST